MEASVSLPHGCSNVSKEFQEIYIIQTGLAANPLFLK